MKKQLNKSVPVQGTTTHVSPGPDDVNDGGLHRKNVRGNFPKALGYSGGKDMQ